MSGLNINLTPALLDEGSSYERVAFGQLEITAGGQLLTALTETEGHRRSYQPGPYVSGYHFAEWLVWNWWRLRWEPSPSADSDAPLDWDLAHRMSDIGEGYAWPNITFSSDGFQCDITAERSYDMDASFFSYLGAPTVTVPWAELERAIDEFIDFVLQRLADAGISDTNLQTLWKDLSGARNDAELTRCREIEARLGYDPDEADADRIATWLADVGSLGVNAMGELATGPASNMLSAKQVAEDSASYGFTMNLNDGFRLATPMRLQWGSVDAWRIGIAMANAVRHDVGLKYPVSNKRLADLAGIPADAINHNPDGNIMSWVFSGQGSNPSIAIRPRGETGRRFDVSRLLGDRLFANSESALSEPLSLATRSHSYRQKAQRVFAAQLLCPWEIVQDMLNGDFSDENQEQIAEHFNVSTIAIKRQMGNSERYSLAS